MAKSEKSKPSENDNEIYSNAVRFDAEFKKRQVEIQQEISIWSQSESYGTKVREHVHTALCNHDELVNLSRRLFENGVFTSNFGTHAIGIIRSNNQTTWIGRLSSWLKFIVGGFMGGITILFGQFLINKYL